MKILSAKMRMLSNTELFEFFRQLVQIIVKHDAAKLKVNTELQLLEAQFPKLQIALDKEQSNELTQLLLGLDRARDLLINGFVKWLDALTLHPNKATASIAERFLTYAKSFGKNIAQQTQLSETTILTNITDAFTKDADKKTGLATINGTEWIEALKENNDKFSELFNTRVSDDSAKNEIESFTTLRKFCIAKYEELTDLLLTRYKAAKADNAEVTTFEKCINDINELVSKINILAETSVAKKKTEVTP